MTPKDPSKLLHVDTVRLDAISDKTIRDRSLNSEASSYIVLICREVVLPLTRANRLTFDMQLGHGHRQQYLSSIETLSSRKCRGYASKVKASVGDFTEF